MSQLQDLLPFNQRSPDEFASFRGNESVLKVLQQTFELPQFIYLWGERFSGKTHLLHAVNDELETDAGNRAVMWLDAQQLLQVDMTDVLPADTSHVLIDDVSELSGVKEGEVALFNLFNHCRSKQITLIVTSSIHAKSTGWHLPDLISRLNSGLVLALSTLDGEEAFGCLKEQFEYFGVPIDDSVFGYIKTHCSSNYSELYHLFLTVTSESLKMKRKVTVPLIKQAISK